jgi:hypothetical protein
MVLYIFITHQKNINICYDRIVNMMKNDFIVVQGGFIKDEYDEDKKILKLNCNDLYVGLPEKVMKTFHYLISDDRFSKYTHFCKLDDDMIVTKRFENLTDDYLGNVSYQEGSRNWHIGRCGNFWDKVPYLGKFVPWCMGGFGYIVSRQALQKVLPNFNYSDHIYEDLYLAIILNSSGVFPKMINTKEYLISPDHK